jgi:hypothetical protein
MVLFSTDRGLFSYMTFNASLPLSTKTIVDAGSLNAFLTPHMYEMFYSKIGSLNKEIQISKLNSIFN